MSGERTLRRRDVQATTPDMRGLCVWREIARERVGMAAAKAMSAARVVCCIPARYAATRLPGKPLLRVDGEPMIAHVIRAARLSRHVDEVLVATDHAEIASVARAEGVEAVMTDSALPSGTDRVAAAMRLCDVQADVVVNVQCDEPRIDPASIDLVSQLLLRQPSADMGTLSAPLDTDALLDVNRVKVVSAPVEHDGSVDGGSSVHRALFFSRAPIGVSRERLQALLQPTTRCAAPVIVHGGSGDAANPSLSHACRLHVGLYSYRAAALHRLVALPPSPLELLERLEQLRALEAGMHIAVGHVARAPLGVDTAADLRAVQRGPTAAPADTRSSAAGIGAPNTAGGVQARW